MEPGEAIKRHNRYEILAGYGLLLIVVGSCLHFLRAGDYLALGFTIIGGVIVTLMSWKHMTITMLIKQYSINHEWCGSTELGVLPGADRATNVQLIPAPSGGRFVNPGWYGREASRYLNKPPLVPYSRHKKPGANTLPLPTKRKRR